MTAPHVTVWHLVGALLILVVTLGALWLSLWIGGRK